MGRLINAIKGLFGKDTIWKQIEQANAEGKIFKMPRVYEWPPPPEGKENEI